MRRSGQRPGFLGRTALVTAFGLAALLQPAFPQAKPTGSPLVLSSIETEQEVPLAILLPDGKTARCVPIRLHWNSAPSAGPHEEATSFTVDLPAENPATPIFTAQLWNASLASALAWQTPWSGARWKVLQTPVCDGTGIDAALAVGMISTSARRAYPPKTVVIGSLNPDGSLGPVSHLVERLNAAASAGMTRVIIPSVQRFDADASGQVVNIVRHAADLHLECIPVDDLAAATETTMNDPLPDTQLDSSIPKYSNEVASYIDDFAHHEQNEASSGLKFAPKETELAAYPPRLAAIWKSVYADDEAGEQAYRAGQVGVAYHLFCRANGRMNGANALSGQTRITFNVKTALTESDELHDHLQTLMNPPAIDRGELQSALLVAEMADWAYEIDAALEGSQLVAKQAFSMRSEATEAEKDRAREAILFANAQCKYLLTQANFYTGLASRVTSDTPLNVDENAAHLIPQLIPAQLATARHFTDGIRASDLRDGLLFDPRLVAYINVLRQEKADWDARQRKKDIDTRVQAAAAATATAQTDATGTTTPTGSSPVKLNSNSSNDATFDPGDTYRPPHTVVATVDATKKTSDAALCLIWVNHDCEIATLDQKYLRLNGTMDPLTHEWKLKDRARLDALLQMAEIGARHGIAFAQKAEVNPSVLAMIYERAAHDRIQGDDASALAALRNYWRCALLGNMCWQLAHTQKAQPVEASAPPVADTKTAKTDDKKSEAKQDDDSKKNPPASSTNVVVVVNPPNGQTTTKAIVTPAPPVVATPAPNPPVVPIATVEPVIPVAPIAAHEDVAPAPAPVPAPVSNPPVAPVAAHEDIVPAPVPAPVNRPEAVTNPPVVPVAPKEAPRATPVVEAPPAPAPTPAPAPAPMPAPAVNTPGNDDANVPVAPIAKVEDYTGPSSATTNAPASIGPIPPSHKSDNADSHSGGGF